MIKKISKIIKERAERKNKEKERQILIKKVERGTDFAIQRYSEVFKKLAEYDKK